MDLIALYGAILATITAGWTIYREWSDRRGKLLAHALYGHLHRRGKPESNECRWLFQIRNVGRVDVTLEWIGFINNQGEEKVLIPISSSVARREPSSVITIGPEPGPRPEDIVKLWATDQVGRKYRIKIPQVLTDGEVSIF